MRKHTRRLRENVYVRDYLVYLLAECLTASLFPVSQKEMIESVRISKTFPECKIWRKWNIFIPSSSSRLEIPNSCPFGQQNSRRVKISFEIYRRVMRDNELRLTNEVGVCFGRGKNVLSGFLFLNFRGGFFQSWKLVATAHFANHDWRKFFILSVEKTTTIFSTLFSSAHPVMEENSSKSPRQIELLSSWTLLIDKSNFQTSAGLNDDFCSHPDSDMRGERKERGRAKKKPKPRRGLKHAQRTTSEAILVSKKD